MKKMDGGVTAAKGFMASNTAAKIKYEGRDVWRVPQKCSSLRFPFCFARRKNGSETR